MVVMVGGMTHGGIRIAVTPGQDRGAIDDEVARADEATMERETHYDHQERLSHRGSRPRRSLPLLRRTGDPWAAPLVTGQATGERQGGPRHQPVVQVLVGEMPESAHEREQQQ